MVELVTPGSVDPVACPLPHGEGSVPNLVEELDAAPPWRARSSTPVAVSVVRSSADPTTRMPVNLLIQTPRSVEAESPVDAASSYSKNR